MTTSRTLQRIQETRDWPDNLWAEVIRRFACLGCQSPPGKGCVTNTGKPTTHHVTRMRAASEAIVDALDAGEDPKKVGLPLAGSGRNGSVGSPLSPGSPPETTMSTFAAQKTAHLKKAENRWDDAVQRARRFLTDPSPDIRELARLMLTASGQTMYSVLGGMEYGFGIAMNGYVDHSSEDLCSRMEFIGYFIGHELLDDGEPGIAYYRATDWEEETSDTYVTCGPDHENAQPYFHRNVDILRQEYPEAKLLNVRDAIWVIQKHEQDRLETAASIRADIAEHGNGALLDEEDAQSFDDTPEQAMRAALVAEIIALPEED